jgi:hypothetical protein
LLESFAFVGHGYRVSEVEGALKCKRACVVSTLSRLMRTER